MIKLKSILETIYKNGKEFEHIGRFAGKIWRVIVSPAIQNSPDNPNRWAYRGTLYSFKDGKYTPEDHFYIDSIEDETIISSLKLYELFNWKRIR